jgi:hypothetical protein
LFKRRLQRRHLALMSHELGEATRSGDLEPGSDAPKTLEFEDVQRTAQTLRPSPEVRSSRGRASQCAL